MTNFILGLLGSVICFYLGVLCVKRVKKFERKRHIHGLPKYESYDSSLKRESKEALIKFLGFISLLFFFTGICLVGYLFTIIF